MKAIALLGLLLLSTGLHARDVNKCVDSQGNVMLTDESCTTAWPKKNSDTQRPTPAEKPPAPVSTKPLPPILPTPEQQLPPAPKPAPAEKPAP